MATSTDEDTTPLAPSRLVGASQETSRRAPFMKGPIRLALASGRLRHGRLVALGWDPDHLLQRLLLRALLVVCGRDQIADLSTRMWRANLSGLKASMSARLARARETGRTHEPELWKREGLASVVWPPLSRVLYLGCGSGRETLLLRRAGLRSVGIDSIPELVLVARDWAAHLSLPRTFAAMDASRLGLAPRSMDGLLLEFYSCLPHPTLTTAVQAELADVLRAEGVGVVVAMRLRYVSHWWLMGTGGQAPLLTKWLAHHARHDCGFAKRDRCEESLAYGLYARYHTTASMAAELTGAFEVIECFYEREDPRYVLALVRPRQGGGCPGQTQASECGCPVDPLPDQSAATEFVERVERICAGACVHQHEMEEFFSGSAEVPTDAQISCVLRSGAAESLTCSYLDCVRWASSAGYLSDWLV